MQIYIGEKGLDQSWQAPFKKVTECCKCSKEAQIMFVGIENYPAGKGNFICDLRNTTGKEGGLWLHAVCAVAVYLCPYCLEATAIVNQG